MDVVNPHVADRTVDPEMSALPDLVEATDIVKRRRLPLDQISPEDEKLRWALAYWQSRRRDGLLPARKDVDIVELRPVVGTTHLVDVSADDPAKYRFRIYGTAVRQVIQNYTTELVLGAWPSKALRDSVIEDYSAVAFTGTPSYHHVVALIDYVTYSYSRLILPMANDGRQVNMLLVCINARKFSDFTL